MNHIVNIENYMQQLIEALKAHFHDRLFYVGLQGSYLRGEATESSDIDMVVILDALSADDISRYHAMLNTLAHRELVCGFLSGKRELFNWDTSDLFQFYHDTKPIRGSLDALLPLIDDAAVARAIKLGICNIYHGCVHNMLHTKSEHILRDLYKAASFVVQAICYRQKGTYVSHLKELAEAVSADERNIVNTFIKLKAGGEADFRELSEQLFAWCQNRI